VMQQKRLSALAQALVGAHVVLPACLPALPHLLLQVPTGGSASDPHKVQHKVRNRWTAAAHNSH
jgi:hypothetical protein